MVVTWVVASSFRFAHKLPILKSRKSLQYNTLRQRCKSFVGKGLGRRILGAAPNRHKSLRINNLRRFLICDIYKRKKREVLPPRFRRCTYVYDDDSNHQRNSRKSFHRLLVVNIFAFLINQFIRIDFILWGVQACLECLNLFQHFRNVLRLGAGPTR